MNASAQLAPAPHPDTLWSSADADGPPDLVFSLRTMSSQREEFSSAAPPAADPSSPASWTRNSRALCLRALEGWVPGSGLSAGGGFVWLQNWERGGWGEGGRLTCLGKGEADD